VAVSSAVDYETWAWSLIIAFYTKKEQSVNLFCAALIIMGLNATYEHETKLNNNDTAAGDYQ
jgi:hypothetical protein